MVNYSIALVDAHWQTLSTHEVPHAESWWDAEEEGNRLLNDQPDAYDFLIRESP